MKLHNSLNSISVFQYWKMQYTKDLRYLIRDVDLFDLPEIEITQDFYESQMSLFKDFDSVEVQIQILYADVIKTTINHLDNKTAKNEQKNNNAIHKYLKYLNNNYQKFTYKGIDYKDVYDIYKLIKETSTNFLIERCQILDYHTLNCESSQTWELYEELPKLCESLGFNIDEFNTSMKKYIGFRNYLLEKIKNGSKNRI